MPGLFLDHKKVRFEFEKLGSETMLPEDPNVWPNEILQELYKQVSYIADFTPKVVPAIIDGEKGYGFGHIEVTSKTGAQNPTPAQEEAAGIRHVRIPFLIKDRKLMPLDLLLTDSSKLMPLTETRMRQALFRPQSFDVTSKTPGDASLIGQLYPPYRQNYGFGGGGGVVNIGMGKMGEADKSVGDTARHMLLHGIYRGDVGQARKGRAALVKQKGTAADIAAHDRYIAKMGEADTFMGWLAEEYQSKEASDVEELARTLKERIKKTRKDPAATLDEMATLSGLKSASAQDPRLPGEDRRLTGPSPEYMGLKSPTNKIEKKASKADKAILWAMEKTKGTPESARAFEKARPNIERAIWGAGIGLGTGAGMGIGYHEGSKGRPGREAASGKYRTKKSSILPSILRTINETDFQRLATLIDEPEVKLAFLQNEDASKALAPLGSYRPVPAEKRAEAFVRAIPSDVAQIRRLGDGTYEVKVASHRFWAPRTSRVDRGQLVDLVGTKLAMDVDTNESVTMADGAQVDMPSPEQDKLAPIVDFGLYRYAMQADIAGVRAGEGMAIPEGDPHGHGAFFRVLPNGKAEATVPMTIKGQVEGGYMVEAFDGAPVTVMPQAGIEGFALAGDTLLVPQDVRWLDLDQAQEVQLVEQPGEPGQKEAMARAISVDIRSSGPNTFSIDGPPVSKLAYAQKQMLSFDDASFLLAGLGVQPPFAMHKLSEAVFAGKPVTVPTCRVIKTAGERMHDGLLRARDKIASRPVPKVGFLVKEAAMIPDTTSVDVVLSLGFLNEENINEFLKSLPVLEDAQLRMSELLYASRVGLQDVPDQALERAIRAVEKVIEGLKVLAFTEN